MAFARASGIVVVTAVLGIGTKHLNTEDTEVTEVTSNQITDLDGLNGSDGYTKSGGLYSGNPIGDFKREIARFFPSVRSVQPVSK